MRDLQRTESIQEKAILATLLLAENSHQGFEVPKTIPHQDESEVNSNLASGLEPRLRRNDVGPRCSGKERDVESGSDDLGARYYYGGFGRFLSTDPVRHHQFDPQSLNKYAYSRNDPLNLKERNGKFWECAQWEDGKCVDGYWDNGPHGRGDGSTNGGEPDPHEQAGISKDAAKKLEDERWDEFWKPFGGKIAKGNALEGESFKDCISRNLGLLGIDTKKVQDETNQIILSVGLVVAGLDNTTISRAGKDVSVLNYVIGVISTDIAKFVLDQTPSLGKTSAAFQTVARLLKGGAIGLEITGAASVGVAAGLSLNCRNAYGK